MQIADGFRPMVVHDKHYVGFVDTTDLVAAILDAGLARPKPEGWLKRLGNMFSEDDVHRVDHAVNKSGLDAFKHVSVEASLLKVGVQAVS